MLLLLSSLSSAPAIRPAWHALHPGWHVPTLASPRLRAAGKLHMQMGEEDPGELDASDTTDSWESQMAEQEAWLAAQKKKSAPPASPVVGGAASTPMWDGEVDEDAYFDEEDDEDDATRVQRQAAEKQASIMLARIEAAGGGNVLVGAKRGGPDNAKVMTSLSSILTAMMRLEEKVDALNGKVDQLLEERKKGSGPTMAPGAFAPASSPSSPSSPAASEPKSSPPSSSASSAAAAASGTSQAEEEEWDGNVDESAYFDDDGDDDLADWRDVRKAKAMLEAMSADEPVQGADEDDGNQGEDGKASD